MKTSPLTYHHRAARRYQRHLWLLVMGVFAFLLSLLRLFVALAWQWHLGMLLALGLLLALLVPWRGRQWAQQRALAWLDAEVGLSYRSALEYSKAYVDDINRTENQQKIQAALWQRAKTKTHQLALPQPQAWWLPLWLLAALLLVLPALSFNIKMPFKPAVAALSSQPTTPLPMQPDTPERNLKHDDSTTAQTEQDALDDFVARWQDEQRQNEAAIVGDEASSPATDSTSNETSDMNASNPAETTDAFAPLQAETLEDGAEALDTMQEDFSERQKEQAQQEDAGGAGQQGSRENNADDNQGENQGGNQDSLVAERQEDNEGALQTETASQEGRLEPEGEARADKENPNANSARDSARQQDGKQDSSQQDATGTDNVPTHQATDGTGEQQTTQSHPAEAGEQQGNENPNLVGQGSPDGAGDSATLATESNRGRLGGEQQQAELLPSPNENGQRLKVGEQRGGRVDSLETNTDGSSLPSFAEVAEEVVNEGNIPVVYHESLRNYFR